MGGGGGGAGKREVDFSEFQASQRELCSEPFYPDPPKKGSNRVSYIRPYSPFHPEMTAVTCENHTLLTKGKGRFLLYL